MKKICDEIGMEYEENALKLIAANSEGAMRDAQSILDRCLSFNDERVDYETVINLLGTVNYQVILEAANHIINRDIKKTMILVDDILNEGKEITIFLDELIICFRNMLIIKTTNSTDNLMRISEEEAEELKKSSSNVSVDEIVKIIEELSIAQLECKRALNSRVLLETKLIKMLHFINNSGMDDLISRIEELESNIAITNGWQEILKKVRSENAGLQAIIRESRLYEVTNKKAVFEFDPKFTFHISAANQPKNRQKFKEILSSFVNEDCEVEFIIKKEEKSIKTKQTIEDVYEDLKNEFGEEIVEFKQED